MKNLIGFEKELDLLVSNYNNNNCHTSIIFHGPKGIGKRTFVNTFVSKIIKINTNNKNYNHHVNLFNNESHPNIKIIKKDEDPKTKKLKSNINIDQIRNLKKFITSTSSIPNLNKIIIVDSCDDLNLNAANSFLKSLEEPNINTYIFLISHQLSSLLPTVRSRCLKIKLNIHNYNNFKNILCNEINSIDEDDIKFYYDITTGSPGSAIELYDNKIKDVFQLTIDCLYKNKFKNIMHLSNLLSDFDNDKFKSYLSILKTILVTLNKIKTNNTDTFNFISDKFKILHELSTIISKKNIIDRFEYLVNNENDLFTYNLDKKIFMLNFLTQ